MRRKKRRGQKKVGREEEGSSSNRPELAALVEALRGTQNDEPMLIDVAFITSQKMV